LCLADKQNVLQQSTDSGLPNRWRTLTGRQRSLADEDGKALLLLLLLVPL